MASPPKLSPEQRERIYTLKSKGLSGRATAELCEGGFEDLPPFKVTGQWCNDLWHKMAKERDELYGRKLNRLPADEAISVLARRLVVIADRETDRLERSQRKGRMNGNQLTALAAAIRRLYGLLKDVDRADAGEEPENGQGSAQGQADDEWIAGMLSDEAPKPPAEIADVVIPNPE